ncbi:MAG TPA: hypothetical protein PLY40_01915 [Bacillota bacterium]|nr:hypothetical protein [Bacillota bacterium]
MTGEPQCIAILSERAAAFRTAEQTNGFLCAECRDGSTRQDHMKNSRLQRFFTHLAEVNPRVFNKHGLGRNRYC